MKARESRGKVEHAVQSTWFDLLFDDRDAELREKHINKRNTPASATIQGKLRSQKISDRTRDMRIPSADDLAKLLFPETYLSRPSCEKSKLLAEAEATEKREDLKQHTTERVK